MTRKIPILHLYLGIFFQISTDLFGLFKRVTATTTTKTSTITDRKYTSASSCCQCIRKNRANFYFFERNERENEQNHSQLIDFTFRVLTPILLFERQRAEHLWNWLNIYIDCAVYIKYQTPFQTKRERAKPKKPRKRNGIATEC